MQMPLTTTRPLDGDLWRSILMHRDAAFDGLAVGARIAVVPRAVAQAESGTMLQWEAQPGTMAVHQMPFSGFARCGADIAFVVDDDAVAALETQRERDSVAELRRQVRRGSIVLYFLKCEGALVRLGYEGFLESLGLTIMGACR